MAPGAGICTSEMGAAIGSRTAPKGCAVLAQPYVLQKQWWGAAMGSRTAPKGGSAPEPPLPILVERVTYVPLSVIHYLNKIMGGCHCVCACLRARACTCDEFAI